MTQSRSCALDAHCFLLFLRVFSQSSCEYFRVRLASRHILHGSNQNSIHPHHHISSTFLDPKKNTMSRTLSPIQFICQTVKFFFWTVLVLLLHCGEDILDRFNLHVSTCTLELIHVLAEVHCRPHARIQKKNRLKAKTVFVCAKIFDTRFEKS